jgi:hypothetical protein
MVLLKSGWEKDYHDSPTIMTIGCAGKIEHHSQLPDGKYNILLSGLHRFRILQEVEGKPYRQAHAEVLEEINNQDLSAGPFPLKKGVIESITKYLENLPELEKNGRTLDIENCLTLAQFVDQVTYQINLPPNKMQDFLEEQDVLKRADSLHALIKLKNQLIQISKQMKASGTDFSMN